MGVYIGIIITIIIISIVFSLYACILVGSQCKTEQERFYEEMEEMEELKRIDYIKKSKKIKRQRNKLKYKDKNYQDVIYL